PYGREGDSVAQLEREAVEREPVAPSDASGDKDARDAEIAACRGVTARELRAELRGDLDTIVLRALKKAPADRYASINDLADDLRRYLAYQPVLAQPDSLAYRARKFVRRNRVAVAAGAGIGLALAAGIAGVLVQSHQVRVEARKAEAVKDFLVDIFNRNSLTHPDGGAARAATAQQLLELGADSIGGKLTDEPEVRAELLGTMALLFQNLSLEERAEQLATEQIRTLRALGGRDAGRPLAAALVQLAGIHANAGNYEKTVADCEEALRVLDGVGARRSATGSTALTLLGLVAYRTLPADDPTARTRFGEALSIAQTVEDGGVQQVEAMQGLAWAAEQVDDYATAEANYRAILALASARPLEIEPIRKAGMLQQFGNLLVKLRRFEEAQPLLEEAVRLFDTIAGANNPLTADARRELARLLESRGERGRAIEEVRSALAVSERVRGADDANLTAGLRMELAGLLWRYGRLDEAALLLDECIELWNGREPDGIQLAVAMGRRVPMLTARGRWDEARTMLTDAKTRIARLRGEKSGSYALVETWEAEALLARDEVEPAQRILQRVTAAFPVDGARLPAVALAGSWTMAAAEIEAGQPVAAVARLQALWTRLTANARSFDLDEEARTRELLGIALGATGDAHAALPHLRRAVELRARMEDPDSPWLAGARAALAHVLAAAGDRDEADALDRQAREALAHHPGIVLSLAAERGVRR
ncbi:MAG TPA: tetratricopeptide repeat protein, partial [Nevskiaceae bacterium]|nr:tetratricopeptide repeat protein [Nevskiaceae bacterium]